MNPILDEVVLDLAQQEDDQKRKFGQMSMEEYCRRRRDRQIDRKVLKMQFVLMLRRKGNELLFRR